MSLRPSAGCRKTPGVACVRKPGHSGVCTVAPAGATLDWDEQHVDLEERIQVAVTLLTLDWPSPPWADLRDPLD